MSTSQKARVQPRGCPRARGYGRTFDPLFGQREPEGVELHKPIFQVKREGVCPGRGVKVSN